MMMSSGERNREEVLLGPFEGIGNEGDVNIGMHGELDFIYRNDSIQLCVVNDQHIVVLLNLHKRGGRLSGPRLGRWGKRYQETEKA